jgi:uncharacterized lipoprotein YmbA
MRDLVAAVALLSLIPACLGPRPETLRYYTLPEAAPAATSGAPTVSLGLGPLTLPAYLTRPELATRLSPERLSYAANDRWAGPLDELVARSLGEDLRAALPAREVVRWPWSLGSPPDVTVAVEFLRFEADEGGGATLDARWSVRVRGGAPMPGESRIREGGAPGDAPGAVAALGRALGTLAREIAATTRSPAPR